MEEDKVLDLPSEPQGASGNKKLLIMVVMGVLILVVLLAAGGVFFLLKGKKNAGAEEGAVIEQDASATEKKKNALYLTLKPPFVVKAKSSGRQRYLQMEVTLVTRDELHLEQLKGSVPQIRNMIVASMGSQVLEELLQPEGREALQQSLLADLQAFMEEETGDQLIEQLLFTTFIMQ